MTRIKESELIIRPDGAIYHLGLRPGDIADTILTVGDPDRVSMVGSFFDTIDYEFQTREFRIIRGTYGGKDLSLLSTGMGTDNIDIVLNELDALVNIDFDRRVIKEELRLLNVIRLGTSGAFREHIPIDSILVSERAMGVDALLNFYDSSHISDDQLMVMDDLSHISFNPYIAVCSETLLNQLATDIARGFTLTAPGFYAPQERNLRLASLGILPSLASFHYAGSHITNIEMETAGIYALSQLLGHRALSFNAILANRKTGEFSQDPQKTIEQMVGMVLDRIKNLD